MVVPMVAGFVVLLVLGIHPPADLAELLRQGATQLAVTP
jgi:hydrogenase-4 component F